ncbi:RAD50 DNA repair protein RAD50 [Spironucleus salmonicida]|uniref:RAD50 DNA repair protein RAD50 n=1 Tax=Spironucleus salmonicida TaxID=348837 RepID=V6LPS4_9EUKA|nr:RAD50 DNA repair protein RAD50 [Spironucleus salmonicida]|eukprot:EST46238.1 RAD50 DNA repair protein RAD50 [Spironucleus salmonicida]
MLKVKSLEFQNIRSFVNKTKVEFSPSLNIIIGPNGAGKTTILEALKFSLSGSATSTFPSQKVRPPFTVTSKIILSDDQVFNQELQITGKSTKRILTQNQQISPGIMNYLLFCSVEESYWMFQKPADLYKTANEIFDVEKLAKFSSELSTEGNRRAKADTNIMDLIQQQKEKQKAVILQNISKQALELSSEVLGQFKEIFVLFNQIIALGDVVDVLIISNFVIDDTLENKLDQEKQMKQNLIIRKNDFEQDLIQYDNSDKIITQEDAIIMEDQVQQFIANLFQENPSFINIQINKLKNKTGTNQDAFIDIYQLFNERVVSVKKEYKITQIDFQFSKDSLELLQTQLNKSVIDLKQNQQDLQKQENLIREDQLLVQYENKYQSQTKQLNALQKDQQDVNQGIIGMQMIMECQLVAEDNRIIAKKFTENQLLENSIDAYTQLQQYCNQQDLTLQNMFNIINVKYRNIIIVKNKQNLNFNSSIEFFNAISQLLEQHISSIEDGCEQANYILKGIDQVHQLNVFSDSLKQFVRGKSYDGVFLAQLVQLLSEFQIQQSALASNKQQLLKIQDHIEFGQFLEEFLSLFNISDIEDINKFLDDLQDQLTLLDTTLSIIQEFNLIFTHQKQIQLFQIFADDQTVLKQLELFGDYNTLLQNLTSNTTIENINSFQSSNIQNINVKDSIAEKQNAFQALQMQINELQLATQTLNIDILKLRGAQKKRQNLKINQEDFQGLIIANSKKIEQLKIEIAQKSLLAESSEKALSSAQNAFDELNKSVLVNLPKILSTLSQIDKFNAQKHQKELKNEIRQIENDIIISNSTIQTLQISLQNQQQHIFKQSQITNLKAKKSQIDNSHNQIISLLPTFLAKLARIFEFHEKLKSDMPTSLSKAVKLAAQSLETITKPHNFYAQNLSILNEFLISTSQNFKSLANSSQALQLLGQKQLQITRIFAQNLTNFHLSKELKTASIQLKTAITTFQDSCFTRANSILESLWVQVYSRKDIETIKLSRNVQKQTLEILGLSNHEWRPLTGMISAGQKALASILIRVALVSALNVGVAIFSTDEPTNFLDEGNEGELARVLAEFCAKSQLQFLVITHSESFGERIMSESQLECKVIKVVGSCEGSRIEREVI